MLSRNKNPTELTLGSFLSSLKLGQLWTIGVALVALVSGAFSLGFYVASTTRVVSDQKNSVSDQKLSILEQRLSAQEPQLEFFTRYLRYLVAEKATKQKQMVDDTNNAEFDQAERMFFDLICSWWKNQNVEYLKLTPSPNSFGTKVGVIGKGEKATDSHVTFADQTTWTIPPEVKFKVLNDTRCRAS